MMLLWLSSLIALFTIILHVSQYPLLRLDHGSPIDSKPNHIKVQDTDGLDGLAVAIIGAGAGGSASAFWLSKAEERFDLNISVDIYEQLPYVGGRSFFLSQPGVEFGAYQFDERMRNLWRAVVEFNLPVVSVPQPESLNFWNGYKLFKWSNSIWDLLVLHLTYGVRSTVKPYVVDRVGEAVSKFEQGVYRTSAPIWESPADMVVEFGLTEFISTSTSDFVARYGNSGPIISDFMFPLMFGPFGHDAYTTHMLQGAFSMQYSYGNFFVKGGTNRIFQEFVNRSQGSLFLNTKVEGITPQGKKPLRWSVRTANQTKLYDAIIFAAPFGLSGVSIHPSLSSVIPPISYKTFHVTVVSTPTTTLNHTFLGFPSKPKQMHYIFTNQDGRSDNVVFNAMIYERQTTGGSWLVKIWSEAPINDDWLFQVFNRVEKVYHYQWEAPILAPTTQLPPFELDTNFYYLSGFESVVSTMETQVIAARNVVSLLLRDNFGVGICGYHLPSFGSSSLGDVDVEYKYGYSPFINGWDC